MKEQQEHPYHRLLVVIHRSWLNRKCTAAFVPDAPSAKAILPTPKGEQPMLYHVDFHIEYPASMSQKDFFSIWAREAEAAFGAKKAGVVIDIWKCVGSRRVMAVANVDSLDMLDQILLDLPIMKAHGQHVQIDVTPLRRLEDFATDLKKRLE